MPRQTPPVPRRSPAVLAGGAVLAVTATALTLGAPLPFAARVLPRRGVTVTPAHTAWLTTLYRRLS